MSDNPWKPIDEGELVELGIEIENESFESNELRNKIYFGAPGTGKSYTLNEDKEELLSDFFILSGKNEKGEEQEFAAAATYGEIKKWFLKQFPELNIKRKTIDEILGNTAA